MQSCFLINFFSELLNNLELYIWAGTGGFFALSLGSIFLYKLAKRKSNKQLLVEERDKHAKEIQKITQNQFEIIKDLIEKDKQIPTVKVVKPDLNPLKNESAPKVRKITKTKKTPKLSNNLKVK